MAAIFNIKYRKLTYIFRNNLIVPHCLDGQQNEDERGVDCGGSCKPCQGMNFDNAYRVLKCVFILGVHIIHLDLFW